MKRFVAIGIVVLISAATALFIFSFAVSTSLDLSSGMESTIIRTVPSPDGKFAATEFQIYAGSKNPSATIINLQKLTLERPDPRKGATVLSVHTTARVDIEWTGANLLNLSYPLDASFKSSSSWNDVKILHINRR